MVNHTNTIALFRLEETDSAVLRQILDIHPDRIHCVTVTNKDNITIDHYSLCLTSATDMDDSPVPVLTLKNNTRMRVGTVIDDIEGVLLQNRYDDTTCGAYTLKWRQSVLEFNGHVTELTERERYLIAEILNGGDQGQKRDYLLNAIWGYRADLETHTLETHIYRLRQKIEDEPDNPKRLITIEGGYKLA